MLGQPLSLQILSSKNLTSVCVYTPSNLGDHISDRPQLLKFVR